jgi:carbohydrate-selective porin OprB
LHGKNKAKYRPPWGFGKCSVMHSRNILGAVMAELSVRSAVHGARAASMACGPARTAARTLALTTMLAAAGALATDYPTTDFLTGDRGGVRDELKAQGYQFFLKYNTEPMWNVSGGEEWGGTYLHNIGADFLIDLDRVIGLPSTTLLVKLSKRDGDSVSAEYIAPSEAGNIFPVQEIFGGRTFKVVNVQFNTNRLNDRLQLAYGRIVANDDFLRSDLFSHELSSAAAPNTQPPGQGPG